MNHLVSIVIPAYNSAKRIEATLLSVAAQDYGNMEIIVVDDASTDGTGGIAEKILKASGRNFKLIRHDINMGECAARNTGLKAVSGDYVIFVDSDDLTDPDYVSVLLKTITAKDSDIAFCGFKSRYEGSDAYCMAPVKLDPSREYSAEELAMKNVFNEVYNTIWTTIFKTSFLKTEELEFTVGCTCGGDMEFLTKAFSLCGAINFTTGCHYTYILHKDSVTSNTMLGKAEKKLELYILGAENLRRIARFIAERGKFPKVRDAAHYLMADGYVNTLTAAARQRDKAKFFETLRNPETRKALKAGLWYLTRNMYIMRKSELFGKALTLLTLPSLYFWIRSASWKYKRV